MMLPNVVRLKLVQSKLVHSKFKLAKLPYLLTWVVPASAPALSVTGRPRSITEGGFALPSKPWSARTSGWRESHIALQDLCTWECS